MTKIITVSLSKTKEETLKEASRLLQENSVEHTISNDGGSFSSEGFAGRFRIIGNCAEIEVTKKPMLIPWFAIESQIKSYFA